MKLKLLHQNRARSLVLKQISLTKVYECFNTVLRSLSVFFVTMKKLTTLIFLIGFINLSYSQEEKSTLIYGTIMIDSIPLENVHVINKNTSIGTITNSKGEFKIPVLKNDTLFVSHINIKNKEISISEEIFSSKKITLHIGSASFVLDEITIKKRRSIFYVDPQIIPEHIVNATTLKLPYAKIVAKKNGKIAKLTLTSASVNLDNLLNFFNGKTKRVKKLKALRKSDAELAEIRKSLSDFFFEKQLKIKKEYINQFLSYCLTKNIIEQFKKGNQLKLTEILIRESKKFPHKKINQETLLTKTN